LVTHGILHSARGVDGGYMLERKPQDISLLDVIEAIDGPLSSDVLDDDGEFDGHHEKLRGALRGVTDTLRDQLQAIKLAHLISMKR
jgi:Rrf2 family protein